MNIVSWPPVTNRVNPVTNRVDSVTNRVNPVTNRVNPVTKSLMGTSPSMSHHDLQGQANEGVRWSKSKEGHKHGIHPSKIAHAKQEVIQIVWTIVWTICLIG